LAGDGLYLEVVITERSTLEVFVDGPLGRGWCFISRGCGWPRRWL